MDQANTLRRLMQLRRRPLTHTGRGVPVVTVSSGKGGVGKSCLVANLGTKLAREGFRILLVDGDLGLANLDILMGARVGATLEDVLAGRAGLGDALCAIERNLWLLPSASGFMDLREQDHKVKQKLLTVLEGASLGADLVIIDAGAGVQPSVLGLHHPSFETVVILTPEPTALADGYGLLKLLRRDQAISRANVIVNRVADGREGVAVFRKLGEVAARFTDIQLEYLGHCERDEKFTQSVMKRKILLDLETGTPAVACLELLAKRLRSKCLEKGELTKCSPLFWRTLLEARA